MNPLIYLYVKESPLGLKYLGQTTKNPYTYMGSGTHWKRHIKKHKLTSEDITTKIIFETCCREELKQKGLYYSYLYNIVEDLNWANLIPESGEKSTLGYRHTEEQKERQRIYSTGRKLSPEACKKISDKNKGRLKTNKQKESARSIWLGKERPKHITDILMEVNSYKVVNIKTGFIYQSIAEAARFLNISTTGLRHQLMWADPKCLVKYQSQELTENAIKRSEQRKNAAAHRNPKKLKSKASKYIGVYWNKIIKKWVAQIRTSRGRICLGKFLDEDEAGEAYKLALQKIKDGEGEDVKYKS